MRRTGYISALDKELARFAVAERRAARAAMRRAARAERAREAMRAANGGAGTPEGAQSPQTGANAPRFTRKTATKKEN